MPPCVTYARMRDTSRDLVESPKALCLLGFKQVVTMHKALIVSHGGIEHKKRGYPMKLKHRKARKNVPEFLSRLRSNLVDFNEGMIFLDDLKDKYAPEYNSLRKAIEREKKGGPSIDDRIRFFPDFLRLVVLEIGPRQPNTTLDRVSNYWREYAPKNLRWASPQEQAVNRSTTKTYVLTHPAKKSEINVTLPEFIESDLCPPGLKATTIRKRLSRGVPPQAAFFGGKGIRQNHTHKPLETPGKRLEVKVIEAYMEAIYKHFPTMRDSIGKPEREQLRRWAYESCQQSPERALKVIIEHWDQCQRRVRETSEINLPKLPWPKFLLKYTSPLREAYLWLSRENPELGGNEFQEYFFNRQRNENRLKLVVNADDL